MAKINGMPWNDGDWEFGHSLAVNPEIVGEWWEVDLNGLEGTNGADEIYGYGGNDVLQGRDGNDILDGGEGTDLMNGGAGDDTYYVDNVGDIVEDVDVGLDVPGGFSFDAGYDTVVSTVNFTLGSGVERLFLAEGSAATDGTGNSLDNTIHGNSNENELRGGGGRDWLYGNGDNDTLRGEAGDDFLYGGSHGDSLFGGTENDLLDGGTGGDKMRGEAGNDRYYVDNTLDEVIETANQGYDTVFSSISHALWVNVEELRLLDSGGAINGTGNALNNDIYGNDSANTLDGGGGNDDLVGNGGDDTYWIENTGDRVFESAGEGIDTVYVRSLVDYTLGANVEDLVLWTGINGTGNGLANRISGNVLDNVIDGGLGNDTLNGGQGSDTASFASWDALTQGQFESIRIDLAQGTAQRTLPIFNNILIESDTLTGFEHVRASNLTETIVGDGRDNKLEGRGGNDVLQGNYGNDGLDGGDGRDTASYQDNLGRVFVNLGWNGAPGYAWEFFTMPSGPQAGQEVVLSIDGLVSIENVRGSAFADYLVGNQEDNIIDGRGSADQMFGATGNDTYLVDNAADAVGESAGAGTLDIVRASVSYALAAGSEVEVLETTGQSGTASINLTGNEFANTINGNNGANTLNGGGSADTMSGFSGSDTYIVDTQQDTVIEGQGQGTNDRVQTSVTYALAEGCEIETLETTDPSGTGAITLIGNEFDNSIVGNDGVNVMVGGDGRDTLTGRGDIDAFLWSSIDDTGLNIFDADIVTDYSRAQGDVLHFTNMDADETVAGDQNFTFISTAAFTAPGQINWFSNGTNTFIQLNTDADLTADGVIQLNGVPSGDAVLMFL